jgi:elongation factor G
MKDDDLQPKTQPSGSRPPPRPPRSTAIGLGPDGDDSDKKRRGDDSDKKRRMTISKVVFGEGKFIRQSGGTGQYGHVKVKIEPGKGVEIVSDVSSDAIPARYIKPVTDAIREALDFGVVYENCPIVDIVVRIVDGSFDETDSSDLAFKMAGIFSIKDAMKKADPIIIE